MDTRTGNIRVLGEDEKHNEHEVELSEAMANLLEKIPPVDRMKEFNKMMRNKRRMAK